MKKFFIYLSLLTIVVVTIGYFSLSSPAVQKIVIKSIFESRLQGAFVESEVVNSDKLEIFFCGSGSPLSFIPEGAQCMALIIGSNIYVIDSGENSFGKISSNYLPQNIKAVFITHAHSDHIGDLDELNLRRWVSGAQAPLRVYGSSEIVNVTSGINLAYKNDEDYRVAHHGEEFVPPENRPMIPVVHKPTDRPQLIFEDQNIKVESFLVDHFPVREAIGFRIFFGNKKIIISGDTEITDNVFSLVDGADILIHDGMIKDHVSFLEKVAKDNNISRAEIAFHDILDYHADVKAIKKNLENKDLGLLIVNHLVPAKNPIGIRYMEDLFSDVPYKFLLARDNDKIVISKNSDEIIIN